MHDLGSAQKLPARPQTVTPGSIRGLTQKTGIAFRVLQMPPSTQGAAMPKTPTGRSEGPPCPLVSSVVVEDVSALPSSASERLCPVSPWIHPGEMHHTRILTERIHTHTVVPAAVEGPLVPPIPGPIPRRARTLCRAR